ncbi:uncharacterized protein [Cicer arietinum]|uniref:uncharacterized protein n=1 Tax=Cicer arietinum TaxID=3827 RepID=UPI003CC61D7B
MNISNDLSDVPLQPPPSSVVQYPTLNPPEILIIYTPDERSLSTYFTDMKIIWDELDDLRPTPFCTCSTPCSCKLSSVVRTYKHNEYVICFLKGLNDSYQYVRSQILLMDLLPSITKVYSLVIQQDITLIPTHNDATICAVNSINIGQGKGNHISSRGRGKGTRSSMFCTHCKKTNHTIENCHFKHGFPPGYTSKNQSTNTNMVSTSN